MLEHVFSCPNFGQKSELLAAQMCGYCQGWREAIEWAGNLHDSIDPACDHEKDRGGGAGAMGAVIAYRDLIRTERCEKCGRATGGCCTVQVTCTPGDSNES